MFFEFALIGTTASGKSEVANALASEFDAIILSLDSLCVYKEINIASAKPEIATLERIEHFGVNLLSVVDKFNVGLFFDEYQKARARALKLEKPLIIVGGTSFYLKALMSGLSAKVADTDTAMSNDAIFALMNEVDKNAKISRGDTYRLRKWLSIYEKTKQIPSEFLKNSLQKPLIKELKIYELVVDKENLRQRVQNRTQKMLEMGLVGEARELFANFDESLKPLNSIGLIECKDFLRGLITQNELATLINTHTMQLAKRQRTFNKKFERVQIQSEKACANLRDFLNKFANL